MRHCCLFWKWEYSLLTAIVTGVRIDLKYIQNRYNDNRTLYHKCQNTIKSDRLDGHSSLMASQISKSDTHTKDKKLEDKTGEGKAPWQESLISVGSKRTTPTAVPVTEVPSTQVTTFNYRLQLYSTAFNYWEIYIQLILLRDWTLYIYDNEVLPMSSWNVKTEKSPRLIYFKTSWWNKSLI